MTPTHVGSLFYSLDFTFNPTSAVYGWEQIELKPNGSEIAVTINNLEEYIDLVTDFCLCSGLRVQLEAFRGKFAMHTALYVKHA